MGISEKQENSRSFQSIDWQSRNTDKARLGSSSIPAKIKRSNIIVLSSWKDSYAGDEAEHPFKFEAIGCRSHSKNNGRRPISSHFVW